MKRILMGKVCTICEIEKSLEDFYKRKAKKDGLRSECKKCTNEKTVSYRESNPEAVQKINHKQYVKHSEKIKKSSKKYRENNKGSSSRYVCDRLQRDPMFRAIWNIRNRTRAFLKNRNNYSKRLGCSYTTLIKHLESQFKQDMTWENYGEWQIDHKIALSVAYKSGEELFKSACHYTNLQPLWIEDHIVKTNRDMELLR